MRKECDRRIWEQSFETEQLEREKEFDYFDPFACFTKEEWGNNTISEFPRASHWRRAPLGRMQLLCTEILKQSRRGSCDASRYDTPIWTLLTGITVETKTRHNIPPVLSSSAIYTRNVRQRESEWICTHWKAFSNYQKWSNFSNVILINWQQQSLIPGGGPGRVQLVQAKHLLNPRGLLMEAALYHYTVFHVPCSHVPGHVPTREHGCYGRDISFAMLGKFKTIESWVNECFV